VAASDATAGTSFAVNATGPSSALQVTIGVGETRGGVEVTLVRPERSFSVAGTVTGLPGRPVSLELASLTEPFTEIGLKTTTTDATGRFTFRDVPQGRYSITCTGPAAIRSAPDPNPAPGSPQIDLTWGRIELAVTDADISSARLDLRPGHSLSGRLRWKGVKATQTRLPRTVIQAAPLDGREFGPQPAFIVREDGTFTSSPLRPGEYAIGGRVSGWFLESIFVNGRDIAGRSVAVHEDIVDIVVLYTDQPSVIDGRVTDASGRPTNDATVLVYPASAEAWDARYVVETLPNMFAMVRPEANGTYRASGLPTGDYLVAAYAGPVPYRWQNRETIASLRLAGSLVRIDAGRTTTQHLRVQGPNK
jgi:Carboxypeptidase regulatory-like domain